MTVLLSVSRHLLTYLSTKRGVVIPLFIGVAGPLRATISHVLLLAVDGHCLSRISICPVRQYEVLAKYLEAVKAERVKYKIKWSGTGVTI